MKKIISFSIISAMLLLATVSNSFANQNQLLNALSQSQNQQIVIVTCYASWCGPCREEIPHLIKLRNKYSDQDLRIIGINMDDSTSTMKSFNQSMGINYETIHDDGSIGRYYGVEAIPYTAIYAKNGELVYRDAGFVDEEFLTHVVNSELQAAGNQNLAPTQNQNNNSNTQNNKSLDGFSKFFE